MLTCIIQIETWLRRDQNHARKVSIIKLHKIISFRNILKITKRRKENSLSITNSAVNISREHFRDFDE